MREAEQIMNLIAVVRAPLLRDDRHIERKDAWLTALDRERRSEAGPCPVIIAHLGFESVCEVPFAA